MPLSPSIHRLYFKSQAAYFAVPGNSFGPLSKDSVANLTHYLSLALALMGSSLLSSPPSYVNPALVHSC